MQTQKSCASEIAKFPAVEQIPTQLKKIKFVNRNTRGYSGLLGLCLSCPSCSKWDVFFHQKWWFFFPSWLGVIWRNLWTRLSTCLYRQAGPHNLTYKLVTRSKWKGAWVFKPRRGCIKIISHPLHTETDVKLQLCSFTRLDVKQLRISKIG